MKNKYTGVILAGGKGSRMYPFSEDFPKPLLPIINKPLIAHQIELMRNIGIKNIIVLIGYHASRIVNYLGDGKNFGVKITYVEQKETLGIAHAVGMLEEYIDNFFLLFVGDIFFITSGISAMIEKFEQEDVSAVLATKQEKDKDAIKRNFAIIENEQGYIERVIEKPRHIVNDLKGCGLYLFDLHIFDAIRRTPRTAMRDEYELTEAIQILINDKFKVKISNIIVEDLNLTYPSDVLSINLSELKRKKAKKLIGNNCIIRNENKITNSVIGDNVFIENDIKIQNSVIFSDTVVKQTKNINNCIISFNRTINGV